MSDGKSSGKSMFSRDAIFLLVASFFYILSCMIISPILSGYAVSLGASISLAGTIVGLSSAFSFFARPLAGNLSDRLPKRPLALAGTLTVGVVGLGYAMVAAPYQLAILRIITGFGLAMGSVSLSTWFAGMISPEHVGSGVGIYGMVTAVGMAIGPSAGLAIQEAFGYRAAMAASGLSGLLAAACVFLVRDPGLSKQAHSKEEEGRASKGHRFAIIEPRALPPALTIMCFSIPYMATSSFLVSFAEYRNPDIDVSMFFTVYAVALFVLRLVLRRQFDTWSYWAFLAVCAGCLLASIVLTDGLWNTPSMLLGALLMAAGYGVMHSVCQSTALVSVGDGRTGLANSTYLMGLSLGLTLGSSLGSVVIEYMGYDALYPMLAVSVVAAVVMNVIFYLCGWRPRAE